MRNPAWIILLICIPMGNAEILTLPHLNITFSSSKLKPNCASSLLQFINAIPEQLWALKMVDASSKIPAGILSGNLNNIGDRYACTHIQGPGFKGRYFRARIGKKKELKNSPLVAGLYSHAFCLPDTCSQEDFKNILGYYGLTVNMVEDDYLDRPKELDGSDIGFLVLISFIIFFIILGTGLEIAENLLNFKPNYEWRRVLKMFSLISNTKELLKIPGAEPENKVGKRLESLDGIRFISITWVLLCHNLKSYDTKASNVSEALDLIINSFWAQSIHNGFSSVDTFFLLSGVLVSYLTIKELDRNSGRLNWFLFYFHRYVRITVVYAILIFFVSTVYRHLGPASSYLMKESQLCREKFWANLLYIGNFVNRTSFCVSPSWYLDCDMQMFLISPLIIYPLWRKPALGLGIALSIIAGSTGLIAWKHHEHSYNWGSTPLGSDRDNFFEENYVVPWMRIQPYIVGIILGYILLRIRGKINLPRVVVILGWIFAFAVGIATIYGLDTGRYFFEHGPLSRPIAERMAYGSLSRLSWGVAVAWVIFACETGYGGPIYEFLSWEFFKPLSKLTFMIYLMHMTVVTILRDRMNFSESFTVTSITCGSIMVLYLSVAVSYIIHVCLEVPSGKLEKHLVSKFYKKK